MKKILRRTMGIIIPLLFVFKAQSQNPGLVISEILANPAGTDSPFEYVELVATKSITFSATPYSVVLCNNGTATTAGWIAGGATSYGFNITSGTVNAGDVVYVGGTTMIPTGVKLRTINTGTTAGDGFGTANTSGVFGNGGASIDGIAVFAADITTLTNSTVPVDALFYGTTVGTAVVNSGADGYQLPINDKYNGGKLQTTSFFGPDPASAALITATGNFDLISNSWSTPRTLTTTTVTTDGTTSVTLNAPSITPANIGFLSNDTTILESAGSASVFLKITNPNTLLSSVDVVISSASNASVSDYTLAATTVTFAANSASNTTQAFQIIINDDLLPETSEYLIIKLSNPVNATITGITQHAFYITDNDMATPTPNNSLQMNLLTSFSNGVSGTNSAEIVAHDPTTQRLYIANSIGAKLDIVDFRDPSNPLLINSISVTPYGNINSVAVRNGTVAMAIEHGTNPQDSGKVVFLNKDGLLLKQITVGMMPDMITYNHAGTKLYTANEGEPNATYTNDPDGSITVVDITNGVLNATASHITFTSFNGQETTLRSQGIRIYGLGANASKDFEPEYITISDDDTKAWVTLQENNAIAELNLITNTVTIIRSLGSKDYSNSTFGMDVSNVTSGINLSNFPVKGLYLPDAISKYTVGGVDYLLTANEGDARAYTAFSEEKRISALNLDASKFPNAAELKNNYVLGRLNVTDKLGDTDNDGDIDSIFVYGTRSFSIRNAATGQLIYDSGDDFERITSTNSYSVMFNASNAASAAKKDRSDDKGPEPEGITIGTIGTTTYAFIALERIGGVMVYDITNPNAPVFVTYANNRNALTNGPDRGAEGLIFIPQSQSPNGQNIVIAANEVSSTLSIFGVPGCTTPINTVLSAVTNTVFCDGDSVAISVPSQSGLNYQWTKNSANINGATSHSLSVTQAGNYAVQINGSANCSATSLSQSFSVNASPTVSVLTTNSLLCTGQSAVLTASTNAGSYVWSDGSTTMTISVSPTITTIYSVTVNDGSCSAQTSLTQSVSTCTGINELNYTNALTIYPNPFNSGFIINRSNATISQNEVTVIVYNTLGEVVLSKVTSDNIILIESESWKSGIYFIHVNSTVIKAIKQD